MNVLKSFFQKFNEATATDNVRRANYAAGNSRILRVVGHCSKLNIIV